MIETTERLVSLVQKRVQVEVPELAKGFGIRAELHVDRLKSVSASNRQKLLALLRQDIRRQMRIEHNPSRDELREFTKGLTPSNVMDMLALKTGFCLPQSVMTDDVQECLVDLVL